MGRWIGRNQTASAFCISLYRLRFVIGIPLLNTLKVDALLPPPIATSWGYVRAYY
jgi:hypothetical protein